MAMAVLLATLGGAAAAQPISRDDVPPELRPWIAWVLDGVPGLGCARVQGQPVCAWPGRLELNLGAGAGSLGLDVQADRATDLRLPGGSDRWPQDVRLDGAPAPVFDRDGVPSLRVSAGRHRVTGRFTWAHLPESLDVPPEVGLVDLVLDGQPVRQPRREAAGLLWLRARTEAAGEGESLRVQVFRRVADGIPLFVETRLVLEVSGRAREVTLPGALLPGTTPVAVSGDLPARVEKDTMRVQVRGGRYTVRVEARVDGRPNALGLPKGPPRDPWPSREVWVFAADEAARQVELSGPTPIDPSRTELPPEWRSLPAFLMEPGSRLTLAEVRRGEAAPPPDALTLHREIWLDPDGGGASARDRFGGTLRGTTRLDLLAPAVLGRIAVDGRDQLVTTNPETKTAGVELRRAAVRVEADSRIALGGRLPAVGWSTGVEQLQATLHLPPGWSVLAQTGVDRLAGAWTSRWTLLGFFFVLIVTLAVYRLLGLQPAALALATLVLTYGEDGAPFLVWLALVAAVAVQKAAPAPRLARIARVFFLASAAVLVVMLVPFARDQVRDALFPQVAEGFDARAAAVAAAPPAPARKAEGARDQGGVAGGVVGGVVGGLPNAAPESGPVAPPPPAAPPAQSEEEEAATEGNEVRLKSAVDESKNAVYSYSRQKINRLDRSALLNVALEQDPKAVLQTGPGVPSWTWRRYALVWSGPVARDHTMRLVLVSPGGNRVLTALRLALVALFAFVLLTGRWPRLPRAAGREPLPTIAGLVAFLLLPTASARADTPEERGPSPAILEELKQRLLRAAPCEPRCVTTPSLHLRIEGDRLSMAADVHAAADGTWALPGPLATWAPAAVRLDGAPAVGLARLAPGFLHVRLTRGVHRVEIDGPVPPGDSFTLQFPEPPRRATADAPGWDISGLRADGPSEPSILLTRKLVARGAGGVAEGRYAPWLEVTRTLGFGLTWTVSTHVRRVTPTGTPVAVRVPLLPGEAPTRADLVVEHGQAAVSLGGDETETAWDSALEQAPELVLRATEGGPWSEVWRLQCTPIWSCAAEGLPPVARLADGVFAPEYRPWPGEALTVRLRHPQGVEGQTLTIDDVSIEATPGQRLERVRVAATVRSSREQPLVLHVPKDAEIQQVSIDGRERQSRPESGELRLTVPSGRHAVEVNWQQSRGLGLVYAMPRVGFADPAVNVTQVLTLPPDRWLLFTRGPAWGPAVLFWGYLVFVVAVAFVLSRVETSPLTAVQWLLLGVGLSQLPATAALVVAAFVFALAWRARQPPQNAVAFDAVQVLLALWAVVSAVILYAAIHHGLLFQPDMQVAGGGSTDSVLRWYAARVAGETAPTGVLSLPLWVYRVVMLVWALWLAASLVRGVGPGWRAFGEGGQWRPIRRETAAKEPTTEPASPSA
jgi:hypothetical protein